MADRIADPTSKIKVHPGMLMKTREGRFLVSGVKGGSPDKGSGARRPSGCCHGCEFLVVESAKMKVHPGMLMKIKVGINCRAWLSVTRVCSPGVRLSLINRGRIPNFQAGVFQTAKIK